MTTRRSVWLLGFVAISPVLAATAVSPVLEPHEGTNVVGITHPVLGTTWALHIPEGLVAADAVYMDGRPVSVAWKHHADGSVEYTWGATPSSPPRRWHGLPSRTGLRLFVRLQPGPDRIDVRVAVSNDTGNRVEKLFSAGGCFRPACQLAASACADARSIEGSASRTFIRTAEGLAAVSGEKGALYVFDGATYELPIISALRGLWGRSEMRLRSPFIARTDAARAVAVGIGFDRAPSVSHRGPPQRCMHSWIRFGDLAPGQSVERRGVILFGRSLEALFDRFAESGYQPSR